MFFSLFSKINTFWVILFFIILFAIVYKYLGDVHFEIQSNKDSDHSFLHYLYFSAVTQSLLGYGDTIPRTALGKIIIMTQVLITIYFTMSISRL